MVKFRSRLLDAVELIPQTWFQLDRFDNTTFVFSTRSANYKSHYFKRGVDGRDITGVLFVLDILRVKSTTCPLELRIGVKCSDICCQTCAMKTMCSLSFDACISRSLLWTWRSHLNLSLSQQHENRSTSHLVFSGPQRVDGTQSCGCINIAVCKSKGLGICTY